jgi:hypothetical protein
MEGSMVVVGADELIQIFLIFFIMIAIPVWLTLFVKKKMPGKLWAGIALCIFFPFFGHLYLDGATLYLISLFVISIIIKKIMGGMSTWLFIGIISALTMYIRFRNLPSRASLKDDAGNNNSESQSQDNHKPDP